MLKVFKCLSNDWKNIKIMRREEGCGVISSAPFSLGFLSSFNGIWKAFLCYFC